MWNLKQFGSRMAVIDELGATATYQEIAEFEARVGGIIEKRTLVVSLCRNSIGSVLGYISFLNLRIVPIMLNVNLEEELLKKLLQIYLPTYIWLPTDGLEESVFQGMEVVFQEFDYTLVKTGYGKEYPLYEELGLLLTTSGSTGSPKFVRQSYTNILANAESIVQYLELDESERPITTLPMNYTYGLSIINSHFLVGATLLVTEKSFMQKKFWDFFKEEQATSFGGVPYTYEMLNKLRFNRMDLPSLRTMTQAGGKLTPELHARFAEYAADTNKKFVVMYGQCEATARMGYLPAEKAVEKCGSMGIAIPGGRFTLIDVDGRPIDKPHVTGELTYEGANVTLGYAECGEDLAKGDERQGILRTGDMAQFDAEGYYYIVGRKKRFLKIYGNRVNLDEVERLIKGSYEGIDCACGGVDDHMNIYVTDERKADEVKAFLIAKMKLNPVAFKTVVVEKIPKNDAGKILYKELEN